MTPQNDAKYTSLLFTPRTTESARGLPDYRTPRQGGGDTRSGATRSPSPTPDYGRPSREGSMAFGGGGAAGGPFGIRTPYRDGSLMRESSFGQQDGGGRARAAAPPERSRLGQASSGAPRAFSPTLGTPRGRRRSVTPSPPQRDAPPPPPPSASMMDSPAFGGGLLFVDPSAPTQTDDDTYASIRRAAQGDGPEAGAAAGGDDAWVIVFGFDAVDMERVMQEFQKCGDMLQFGTFGAVSRCNWIYIQYQNKYAAQRALQRDGEQLTAALMVGVRRLDPSHRAAIKEYLRRGGGAPIAGPVEMPKAARSSYLINAEPSALVMPRQSHGLKDKIMEYILGL